MKHIYRIILALLLYLGVIYLWGSARQEENLTAGDASIPEANPGEAAARRQQPTELEQLQARQTEERIHELEVMARQQQMMEVATRGMTASRQLAKAAAAAGWTQVLSANQDKYSALLTQAQQDPHGQAACTICDGLSYMPCVMCRNHSGKCVECGGSGFLSSDAYCPTCLGKGKCYVCAGSGKMFCPFCHDGMIDVNWPAPSLSPP